MFSNSESKVIVKVMQAHADKLENSKNTQGLEPAQRAKLEVEQKTATTIISKLGTPSNSSAGGAVELIGFDDPVLVIDDDLLCREMVSGLLKELGFTNVMSLLDGYHAISKIKAQASKNKPVKLIICDWNMPNMSGLELLDIVRTKESSRNIPFYLISANHDKAHILRALKAGVTGYLVKPISFKNLREKLTPHYKN